MNDVDLHASQAARSTNEPLVACVLVTWNSWKQTDRCLRALFRQEYRKLEIIVVDNGSTDGTVQQLRSAYPSVICAENGYNAGFAKACNIGAGMGLERGAEYVWFLNNDTEAPPETLAKIVTRAEGGPRVGIVGAVLRYMHDPSRVQAWGGGSISLWSGYNRHNTRPAALGSNAYITFASALVRRQTFEQLGGLWEEIFLYFEDSDFSLRATRTGWLLEVAEDTAILHAEGGSRANESRKSPLLQKIQTRSGVLFLRRHGRVPLISAAIFVALRLGKRMAQRDWDGLRGVLQGAAEGWRVRRSAIQQRGVRPQEIS
jgi:GT2 family glycosyltransferase